MQNNKNVENDKKMYTETSMHNKQDEIRAEIERLCKCDRILTDSEIADFGDIKIVKDAADNIYDECDDDDIELEYIKLSRKLDLPKETHSFTKIETNLPPCLKYGFRSGLTHMNMLKFSPLTRGHQGPAIAVAAIATSFLIKPYCWNEPVIDQVIEDGDSYYSHSYEKIKTEDRKTLTLSDLKQYLHIQKTHRIFVKIDDPVYAGTFRSDTPKDLHVAKALDLFFKKYNAGVLTSSVLNIAIWKNSKYFNIFDGQARLENCDISQTEEEGAAKLILVQNLSGILFIILEKSNVNNESFVLYGVNIVNVKKLEELTEADDEKAFKEPRRRPSGYRIQDEFRAVVQGSYHIAHPTLPVEFHSRGHLILAVGALLYSKLLSAKKWTKVMIDLIFNQSHIYLTDLIRVLGKNLDENFELGVTNLLCDVVFGVYTAKIKIDENVIPGRGSKGKVTMGAGIRDFFTQHSTGIIEIKKTFYAIWKDKNKFYLFDPFPCDSEGFRVDSNDISDVERYNKAISCVTMNSSVNQLIELILENTESKDKDPFIIHGLNILYIKTEDPEDGSDKIIFRAKKTNRRPQPPPSPSSTIIDECATVVDTLPRPVYQIEIPSDEIVQYPVFMQDIEIFVNTYNEVDNSNSNNDNKKIYNYEIINSYRLMIKGTKNCLSEQFSEQSQGRQGLVIALAAIAESKSVNVNEWTSDQVDKIIVDGHAAFERLLCIISQGLVKDGADEKTVGTRINIQETSVNVESMKFNGKSDLMKGYKYLNLTMLPQKFQIGDKDINLISKINLIEGESNPLVNLGEALEQYFEQFSELVLENNNLMYGIWKSNDKYFLFNSYGNDQDGWRSNVDPAALFVVESVNELVNLLYGLLEFNNHYFILHFVEVKLKSQDETDDTELVMPEFKNFEKYKTKFLPVTDNDLAKISPADYENKSGTSEIDQNDKDSLGEKNSIIKLLESTNDSFVTVTQFSESLSIRNNKREITNNCNDFKEPEQPDAPARLNFALITGIIKIERSCEDEDEYEEKLGIFYEKLKYKHPPPFVTPPKKNFCDLIDIKFASKSMHSLISRFSINSKLSIRDRTNVLHLSKYNDATIGFLATTEKSKLIKLPPTKYFFSMCLSNGLTPIRAINEQYIRDKSIEEQKEEECRKNKSEKDIVMVEETAESEVEEIFPSIIPLGPCIMTPKPKTHMYKCVEKKKKKCPLSEKEKEDIIMKKLVCSTENLLFEMMLPDFQGNTEMKKKSDDEVQSNTSVDDELISDKDETSIELETCGFKKTDDESIGIINANMQLEDRTVIEDGYYRTCFFSSILCILAKINLSVNEFRSGILDRFILAANKISGGIGKLRYKMSRWFRNINILGVKCNVILKQVRYCDPENFGPDMLQPILKSFFITYKTGIIVFENVSYAFWLADDMYYFFDSYPCDENGFANLDGTACLMEICDFDSFIQRIIQNTGDSSNKPYRLYTLLVAHLESEKSRKRKNKRIKPCKEPKIEYHEEEEVVEEIFIKEPEEFESQTSLVEQNKWINNERPEVSSDDTTTSRFLPIKNYKASIFEITILKNQITRPILAPFKDGPLDESNRVILYDREFNQNSVIAESMDICIMAWSQIYDLPYWSVRTVQALYEACKEYTQDSLLASEDTSIEQLTDDLLTEFNIANYSFRVVFAPLHCGTLYEEEEDWNLAESLEKIFDSPVYTGAIVVCENAHIGVMKKNNKMYAWWLVKQTKNIRIIVSEDMEDYLKLIIKEINQPEKTKFYIRIVTISYAKMFGPSCSDIEGLHEWMMPSTSITEIHRKITDDYNMEAIFRQVNKSKEPLFISGTVSLSNRDEVTEPCVKRCYFVALLAVVLKRDITQNPLPEMIDKVLELADGLYKLFNEPKFHTEHILKDISLMDRIFDIRDCTQALVRLQNEDYIINKKLFFSLKKQLRLFFKKYTSGIIQLPNCCYGFWYSKVTNCYYYLDPYQCDSKGRRVNVVGTCCLCIFPSICYMSRQICLNQIEEITGFFIHRIHVESVNSSPYNKFQEDPIWNYLDYHWSYRHYINAKNQKNKIIKKAITTGNVEKPKWKNYLIEVPNLIYSIWGTIGTFDIRFGNRVGKNQIAIAIATFAMQSLCHPSEWIPAVLDSAVICGDYYYRKSKKIASHCRNKFNLSECLKISTYLWNIKLKEDICGTLYGSADRPNLADALEYAFGESKNLLLQCKKKFMSIIERSDAFYITDSSWIGPPLFLKNHGAIYTIRCRNVNMLVYVLIKMLNSNKKLEFTITPIDITFKQETCQSTGSKSTSAQNKILEKPARFSPGKVFDFPSLLNGNEVVSDEDSYLCYSRNLKLGLARGTEFENLSEQSLSNCKKRIGAVSKKGTKKLTSVKDFKAEHEKRNFNLKTKVYDEKSISCILNKTISHPHIVDLLKGATEEKRGTIEKSSFKAQRQFDITSSFICDDTREIFEKYNKLLSRHKSFTEMDIIMNSTALSSKIISESAESRKMPTIVISEEDTEEEQTYRSSIHLNIT